MNRLVHYIVIGVVPNELIACCLNSWKVLTQFNFEFRIWNDEDIVKLIRDNYKFALLAYLNARNLGECSDIARYLIVHHFGGYYVDWDIHLNDADKFLFMHNGCPNGCLIIDPRNYVISNEFFSERSNERYLMEVVEDIVKIYDIGRRDTMNTPHYSGPYRMSECLAKHSIISQDLIPIKEVYEYDYLEIKTAKEFGKNGIVTHYWANTWLK